jgi:uncharacterized protein YrrD
MMIKAKALIGYTLKGLDGDLGKVKEFYFDDHHWAVRYLVADTGTWLTDRQVLISPYSLGVIDQESRHIAVKLTKSQIHGSPPLASDLPVSRQFETAYHNYYEWPAYWAGPYLWGARPYVSPDRSLRPNGKEWDANLRSTTAVSGYTVEATDGELGRVEDFILDDKSWAVRYLVVDTNSWLPGRQVLIASKWIEKVSWDQSQVFINLFREEIRNSPDYSPAALVTREYENQLHGHFSKEGYWVEESRPPVQS